MRLEEPPERMTAANIIFSSARRSEARLDSYFLVRGGLRIAAHGNQLRDDADGDLFRRERAEFESHGRENALEFFGAIAFCFQCFVHRQNFAFAADHADIASRRAHGPGQHAHIFLVSAGDDDEVGGGVRLNFLEGLVVAREDVLRHGEALEIGEGFAVVDYTDGEAGGACGFGHGHGHVAATEEIHDGLWKNRLDENFYGAAADQAVVIGGFIVEIEHHFARRFFLHHFFGGGPDVGFDAASADGAHQGAIFAYEHARAFVAGDGAVGVHDSRQSSALAGAAHLHDFFKEVHVFL